MLTGCFVRQGLGKDDRCQKHVQLVLRNLGQFRDPAGETTWV